MRPSPWVVPLLALALAWLAAPAAAQRLPAGVVPRHYDLSFAVDLARVRFEGTETIRVLIEQTTSRVVLHALDLELRDVTVGSGAGAQGGTVSLNSEDQTATITVAKALPPGETDIRIRYTGILNDKLRGFYLSKGATRDYAVTQFEATDARRAFPCFDEPAFKATFAITVIADRSDVVISNGALLSDTPGPTVTQHTLRFATTPKMSSYLVAIAVGDFQCATGAQDGVPIRICATPDKKNLVRLALESAEQILDFYNDYFAIKYPFGKLDVLAVPDFAAGAMENTAAIFYRETDLLADARTASLARRKNIASVLAHEMAHQWFGDLVTMKWWDDIWLNEGFATWMASRPLAAAKPEWNIPVDETIESQAALTFDSLQSTRPIHVRAETPVEIEETFDAITYEKGAAVLRMVEHYLGRETFRNGVNAYLQAHAYGNATSEDFWRTMAAVSGKPVEAIMQTFVNQPGVPLVTVSTACDPSGKTRVSLRQQRFFDDPALLQAATSVRWEAPICMKGEGGAAETCTVMQGVTQTMTLDACQPWVFANAGARGYYRTEYSSDLLHAMAPRVEESLTAPERLSLLGDEWALVRAGRHSAADYLTLAAEFGRERSSGVLTDLVGRLAFIHEYLVTDATRGRFEAFVRTLFRPPLAELGFEPSPGDSDERRALRGVLIGALGSQGEDSDLVAAARAALARAFAGGDPLDPTSADAIVRVAAAHGDPALYDTLADAAARTTEPGEHYRYLYALPAFRDPALVDRALQHALSPQLRSQDTAVYLARFFRNPAARGPTWAFVKRHWSDLAPKITIAFGDVNFVSSLGNFCDAAARDDIRMFFREHSLPAVARTLDQTLERIDRCINVREKQTRAVATWLDSR